MTRGNQRNEARAKAAKIANERTKGQRADGLTPAQRKEHDAKIMREKQAAKAAKEGGADPTSSKK
ncbi:uncharacterized protein BJ171DRAFT_191274 [Polychytrium aggregatum]|uniref:uncharacterized protein n=1 Tax=Polychytrium aggregatum TaxID=110093 RepID=UPI0022FE5B75|nr:uncharacterized protein BJ171DRAFT_191274 [Polychytrium aggregatum]KAI9202109.1 hypothetical protein BJ171DRAFT_191274 [Polychytrium aggregatum]